MSDYNTQKPSNALGREPTMTIVSVSSITYVGMFGLSVSQP